MVDKGPALSIRIFNPRHALIAFGNAYIQFGRICNSTALSIRIFNPRRALIAFGNAYIHGSRITNSTEQGKAIANSTEQGAGVFFLYLPRTFHEMGGTVGSKEITVTKTPEHADAGQIAVGGGLQIYVAIAHIDGSLLPYPKLAKGLVDGVGGGLLAHSLSLVLADGHLHKVAEEMGNQFLCGGIELVAHHSQTLSAGLQPLKHLGDARVRTGVVERVLHVVVAEDFQRLFEPWVAFAIGNGPVHEHADTIAHEPAHFCAGSQWESTGAQRMVHAQIEVVERVEQRSVEIKYINFVH